MAQSFMIITFAQQIDKTTVHGTTLALKQHPDYDPPRGHIGAGMEEGLGLSQAKRGGGADLRSAMPEQRQAAIFSPAAAPFLICRFPAACPGRPTLGPGMVPKIPRRPLRRLKRKRPPTPGGLFCFLCRVGT